MDAKTRRKMCKLANGEQGHRHVDNPKSMWGQFSGVVYDENLGNDTFQQHINRLFAQQTTDLAVPVMAHCDLPNCEICGHDEVPEPWPSERPYHVRADADDDDMLIVEQ